MENEVLTSSSTVSKKAIPPPRHRKPVLAREEFTL